MTDLYAALRQNSHNSPNGKGWVAMPECPKCGYRTDKEKDRSIAFGFDRWKCFHCGEGGFLPTLARLLDIPINQRNYVPRPVDPPPLPKHWQTNPEAYLKRFLAHPGRVEMWGDYRGYTLDTIARWQLGVGVLPSSACRHTRLIYPAYNDGKLVAFRGRHNGCECDIDSGKWLSCGGSTAALVGRELLRSGATVFVCEAPPDAWLLMQQLPDLVAVAGTAGANTWRPEWTQAIVDSDPAEVIVAYDNDIAGMARGAVRKALLVEWREEHPKAVRPPRAGGWWVLDLLRKAGLDPAPWDWDREEYAPRMDLSDVLMEEMRCSSN